MNTRLFILATNAVESLKMGRFRNQRESLLCGECLVILIRPIMRARPAAEEGMHIKPTHSVNSDAVLVLIRPREG